MQVLFALRLYIWLYVVAAR